MTKTTRYVTKITRSTTKTNEAHQPVMVAADGGCGSGSGDDNIINKGCGSEECASEGAVIDEEMAVDEEEVGDADGNAKIDVDHQLAKRLQAQEQEELSVEEKATLFQQLLEKRRKNFAAKRAEEKRNKPPIKHGRIQAQRFEVKRGKEKRTGAELVQESTKKQKVEDDKEIAEIKKEDLVELYKLVKAKYKSTRPVEDLDLVLWNDLKTMFKPHVEDAVWKNQQDYKVLSWKLYDSCRVHFLRIQHVQIYMLVEKKYPLTPSTLTMMLEKKLMTDYETEVSAAHELQKKYAKYLLLLVQSLLETRFDEEVVFVFVFPEDVMGSVNLTLLSLFFGVTATNLSPELLMLGQTLNDVVPQSDPFDERRFGLQ
ncbi:hypothetical protein Tco_0359781 [Tanacetum coccineum]